MFAKFSVKKPLTVFVAVMVVLMLAVISFTKMPTDLLPSIDLPYIAVVTTSPGSSSEKVETSVTKPIEGTLSATGGVEKVTSISRENYSMVIFQFSYGTNMDTAMIDMNNKLSQVEAGFEDTVGTPVMMKMNPDMLPVMVASVDMGSVTAEEVTRKVSETVVPALEKVDGVASVSPSGLYEKRLVLTLNQDKIDALNDRLLVQVDSSLTEQREKLEEGKKALQAARLKFETEKAEQTQQLTEKAVQVAVFYSRRKHCISSLFSNNMSSRRRWRHWKSSLRKAICQIRRSRPLWMCWQTRCSRPIRLSRRLKLRLKITAHKWMSWSLQLRRLKRGKVC